MFSKDADITHEAVNKKLVEIVSARGKKGTDRNTQIDLLYGEFTHKVWLSCCTLLCLDCPALWFEAFE